MKLHVGNGSPVEFECRTNRTIFTRSSIYGPEDIRFVLTEVYLCRVVGLEWRASLSRRPESNQKQQKNHSRKVTCGSHRHRLVSSPEKLSETRRSEEHTSELQSL